MVGDREANTNEDESTREAPASSFECDSQATLPTSGGSDLNGPPVLPASEAAGAEERTGMTDATLWTSDECQEVRQLEDSFPTDARGYLFDKYRVIRKLGEGGMGVVLLVRHVALDRERALKVIKSELAENPANLRKFRREARFLAKLGEHPNAVPVHDTNVTGNYAYIEMTYLEGETLSKYLSSQPNRYLPPREVLWILRELCGVIGQAHDLGIIHRDIKPGNIMIVPDASTEQGKRVRVLDFGLAKLIKGVSLDQGAPRQFPEGDFLGLSTWRDERYAGTVPYSSPEQFGLELPDQPRSSIDQRSDVYSLGVVLYETLTGTRPFTGTPAKIIADHLSTPPPPLAERAPGARVPAAVEEVVLACLQKNPGNRPQSASELYERFKAAVERSELSTRDPEAAASKVGSLVIGADHPDGSFVTDSSGYLFGKYRVIRKLAAGGMGSVLLVEHLGLDLKRALKIIKSDAAANPANRLRFKRAARILGKLNHHPNVVAVYDAELSGTCAYIEMEFVDGQALHDYLKPIPYLPVRDALWILSDLCAVLGEAHGMGIIHRDIKPSNIMVVADPTSVWGHKVKVLDFGIANFDKDGPRSDPQTENYVGIYPYSSPEQFGHILPGQEEASDDFGIANFAEDSVLSDSQTGHYLGTYPYSSPEQFGQILPGQEEPTVGFGIANFAKESAPSGLPAEHYSGTYPYSSPEQFGHILPGQEEATFDHRSDIYSLGIVLYEMLAGKRPFTGTQAKIIHDHVNMAPPPFSESAPDACVPEAVEAVVRSCLEKDPSNRPQSAHELLERFKTAVDKSEAKPFKSTLASWRRSTAGLLAAFLVVILIVSIAWTRNVNVLTTSAAPGAVAEKNTVSNQLQQSRQNKTKPEQRAESNVPTSISQNSLHPVDITISRDEDAWKRRYPGAYIKHFDDQFQKHPDHAYLHVGKAIDFKLTITNQFHRPLRVKSQIQLVDPANPKPAIPAKPETSTVLLEPGESQVIKRASVQLDRADPRAERKLTVSLKAVDEKDAESKLRIQEKDLEVTFSHIKLEEYMEITTSKIVNHACADHKAESRHCYVLTYRRLEQDRFTDPVDCGEWRCKVNEEDAKAKPKDGSRWLRPGAATSFHYFRGSADFGTYKWSGRIENEEEIGGTGLEPWHYIDRKSLPPPTKP